jgi:cell division protease FtsH
MPDPKRPQPRRPGDPGAARPRMSPFVMIAAILLGFFLFMTLFQNAANNPISFTRFLELVDSGDIVGTVTISDTTISGSFRGPGGAETPFSTNLATNFQTQDLVSKLTDAGIEIDMSTPSPWLNIVGQLLMIGLLVGLMYFLVYRRLGAGGANPLSMGRNKVRMVDRKEMKTTFADVAGVDEAKEELREVVDFLKMPKKYQRLGGRIPKGVLLLGPPGCGKTLLARAVAGEANVPFFFMSGSEFVEMFVGLGAARVRELFQQAKEKAPALVFLDEIDTIGKGRSGAMGAGFGAHDEREQTLNQLLVEMDGFDSQKGVIIMAATNRPDVLDPALVRPGRFDRQVVVDRPDLKGREEILRVHARGVALQPGVDLRTIAARTPGFTGADLENVVNEAALLAARRDKNAVTMAELDEAIDRAALGLERKSRVMSEKEKVRVSVHEMGHALVALSSDNLDPVHRVTIIPRGTAALGLTWTRPLEDRYLATEPELKDMLAFAMGGRVAEELTFDEISTGAQNDLEKATEIARAMVAQYGMSDRVGPLSLGHDDPNVWMQAPKISGHTAEVIDQEVTRLLNEAHDRAVAILTEKRELLDRLSDLLLAVETIEGDDLKSYVGGAAIPEPEEALRRVERAKEQAAAAVADERERERRVVLPPAPPLPTVD